MANYKVGLKTKDIVINEARRLFFEKGYDKTTFQDIAAVSYTHLDVYKRQER